MVLCASSRATVCRMPSPLSVTMRALRAHSPPSDQATMRTVTVKVPLSSANLGPGYDVLSAALGLSYELTVAETGQFEVRMPDDDQRRPDDTNYCVAAFRRIIEDVGAFCFTVKKDAPIGRGLGTSAAAIVAGLRAADVLDGGGRSEEELLALAHALEPHPDNLAASLFGGLSLCAPGQGDDDLATITRVALAVPDDLRPVLAIPAVSLKTSDARALIPDKIPVADAVFNIAKAAQLVLGLERGDRALIAAGLADRIHQPLRAPQYPKSYELVQAATELGAIGATISGAGPSVLLWCDASSASTVANAVCDLHPEWTVCMTEFAAHGADVLTHHE